MNRRLLLADGDRELCDILGRYFFLAGYEVETASSGVDCLDKLRQFLPDVLVVEQDIPFGGADGVLALMREEYPPLPTDVVLVTEDRPADASLSPVVACLRKPFSMSALLRAIRAGNSQLC